MSKKVMLKRLIAMIISVGLMGLNVTLFSLSGFGADPYSALNLGISAKVGVPFGVFMLLVNIVVLVVAFFLGRHLIGIGTLINMSVIGLTVDFLTPILQGIFPDAWEVHIAFRIALLIAAIIIGSFAASIFFTAALGVGPYDTIAMILTQRTKIHFRWCRVACDATCAVIALLFGATIGIGTLISAAFLGPLISFFTKKIAIPLLRPEDME